MTRYRRYSSILINTSMDTTQSQIALALIENDQQMTNYWEDLPNVDTNKGDDDGYVIYFDDGSKLVFGGGLWQIDETDIYQA